MRAFVAILVFCGWIFADAPARFAYGAEPIKLYAAASLSGAFDDISDTGVAKGLPACACVHAASSTLARQIAAGAPADIYISANPAWMDYLVERQLTAEPPRLFAGNTLVLISARKTFRFSFSGGRPLANALGNEWLALADPDHVPAGLYAKAGLKALGHWQGVRRRIARAANVRAALALVTRKEAIAGVVYGSDAASEPRVRIADVFPPGSYPEIRYMAALIGKTASPAAKAYFRFLTTAPVGAILTRHGFRSVP